MNNPAGIGTRHKLRRAPNTATPRMKMAAATLGATMLATTPTQATTAAQVQNTLIQDQAPTNESEALIADALVGVPTGGFKVKNTALVEIKKTTEIDAYADSHTALLQNNLAKKHDGLPHSYFYGPSGVDQRTEQASTLFNANSLTITPEDDKKIEAYLTEKGFDMEAMPSLIARREFAKAVRINDVALKLAVGKAQPIPVPYDTQKYDPQYWKSAEAINASRVQANIPRKQTTPSRIAAFIDPENIPDENHDISPWSKGKDPEAKVTLAPKAAKKPSLSEIISKTWFGKTWLGKKLFG